MGSSLAPITATAAETYQPTIGVGIPGPMPTGAKNIGTVDGAIAQLACDSHSP